MHHTLPLFLLALVYPSMSILVYWLVWEESSTGLFGIIGRRWDIANLCVQQAEESRTTFLAEDMTPLSLSVGELMRERLSELEGELLGTRSRFHVTRSLIDEHHARALRLLERQTVRVRRIDGEAPSHLITLRDTTQGIVDRYAAALKRLDRFRASVGAYLDECRAQVSGLIVEVGDLEMARTVSALQRQITRDEQTATQVVAETLARLQGGMAELRRDVLTRERVACEIAGELPHARDVNVELERLEQVLEDLIPSRTPVRVRA